MAYEMMRSGAERGLPLPMPASGGCTIRATGCAEHEEREVLAAIELAVSRGGRMQLSGPHTCGNLYASYTGSLPMSTQACHQRRIQRGERQGCGRPRVHFCGRRGREPNARRPNHLQRRYQDMHARAQETWRRDAPGALPACSSKDKSAGATTRTGADS
ncbi:hypothetical protein VTK73DRAFT_2929 [Phialemonium thermophilum]|uniref:Uncharacterized protein n=1 Tax=Phialemonium thermophilum TaxID=223376 RepID=A0ABR3VMH5_9PEZI